MTGVILPEKKEIMGVGVHPLTLKETVMALESWIREWRDIPGQQGAEASAGEPFPGADDQGPVVGRLARQVVTLNVEILYKALTDLSLRSLLNQAELVVPDGHGVVWAGRKLGQLLPERVTGIDLIQAWAARASQRGWSCYLLGAEPGVAAAAAERLRQQYPGLVVAGSANGYFTAAETAAVVARISKAQPDLLLVGLGSPKQELLIREHLQGLGTAVAIGVGGSFDVLSGRLRRAPLIYQRLHLEWVYRLLQQPSRWRRMLILPCFMLRVLFWRHDAVRNPFC